MTAKERNRRLYAALLALKVDPTNKSLIDHWAFVVDDLVGMVFSVNFTSMVDSPDAEDLRQEAMCEFHRIRNKLAGMTATLGPEAMFRVLYSVARFSMLRELNRLKRQVRHGDSTMEVIHIPVEELLEEEDSGLHPAVKGPEEAYERESEERFARTVLPDAILKCADGLLGMALPDKAAIRFCVFQRLRGRFVGASFIRERWGVEDPGRVLDYAEVLARKAVYVVAQNEGYRKGVTTQ